MFLSGGPFGAAKALGLTALILRGSAPDLAVLVCRSEYDKYSAVPSASCTGALRRPKPFADALRILSNQNGPSSRAKVCLAKPQQFQVDFFRKECLPPHHSTLWLRLVCFLCLASFLNLLRSSRHFLAWSNSLSSIKLTGYLHSFKYRLKLEGLKVRSHCRLFF